MGYIDKGYKEEGEECDFYVFELEFKFICFI